MFITHKIDPEHLEKYGDLIPGCYHERLRMKETIAIATFDNSSDASYEDELVGVVILDVQEKWVKILWYAMTPDYDSVDYARALIKERLLDAYSNGKAKGIFAILPSSGRKDELEEIFTLAGFDVSFSESKVLSFQLKDLKEVPEIKSSDMHIPLKDVSNKTLRLLSNTIAQDRRAIPITVPVQWSDYDQNLSLVHIQGDRPVGVILIRSEKESALVELAYETTPIGIMALINSLVKHAGQLVSPDTRIVVPLVNTRLIQFLKKIVPDVKGDELMKAYYPFTRDDLEGYFVDPDIGLPE